MKFVPSPKLDSDPCKKNCTYVFSNKNMIRGGVFLSTLKAEWAGGSRIVEGLGRSMHSRMYTRVAAFPLMTRDKKKLQHTLCISEVVIVFILRIYKLFCLHYILFTI